MVLRPDRIRSDNERRRQAWFQDRAGDSSQGADEQPATSRSRTAAGSRERDGRDLTAGRSLRSFQQADTLAERVAPETRPHQSGALQTPTAQACPACGRSMAEPALAPCLLFPCGHSLCAQCVLRNLAACPSCGKAIANHAPNVALQHLLQTQTNEGIRTVAKESLRSMHVRSAPPPEIDFAPAVSARSEQQRVSRDLDRKGARLGLLQGELRAAQRRQASLNAACTSELDALQGLRNAEEGVLRQFDELRERLAHLTKQRTAKEASVLQLQTELAESDQEVARLHSDLPGLETEVDKLRFLLQGIGEMALEG